MTRTDQIPVSVKMVDAANLLGLSLPTVRKLIETGQLPSSKIGRSRLIRTRDIEQLLERNRDEVIVK